jgi:LysR family transcriptional activator of nhaA
MAMMRLLAREDVGLAFLPPIVVRDELQNGLLVEAAQTSLKERFFALTTRRKFPNPLLETVLAAHPI